MLGHAALYYLNTTESCRHKKSTFLNITAYNVAVFLALSYVTGIINSGTSLCCGHQAPDP